MKHFKILSLICSVFLILLGFAAPAQAFCGFYVAKADSKLYNQASQVIIARDGDRTVLTMANDYQGEVKDFALIVPIPVPIQADQVNIGDSKIIERLDAFSAPRLVEYFDSNPCGYPLPRQGIPAPAARGESRGPAPEQLDQAFGVTVEARFTKGEYDILILSAKESSGLENWLRQNQYQIPSGASSVLRPYIRQGMKFFVAKVNLGELEKSTSQFLRPLMIAYESPKFMLPIRLGTLNTTGEQDLIVYILSPKGQAEITNYRTVQIPSDSEIPVFVKDKFANFYKATFAKAIQREGGKAGFLEYAWNMASCDPCSADPLNPQELRQAGVFWLDDQSNPNVFITRLHIRYDRNRFPEDLMFQETANQSLFQGRYILRHPYTGAMQCQAGQEYQKALRVRQEREAQTLAHLTGWTVPEIYQNMNLNPPNRPWWQRIWQ